MSEWYDIVNTVKSGSMSKKRAISPLTTSVPRTADGREILLCPMIAFDRIAGGRYKLRILFLLRRGSRRYGEIGRGLLKGTMGSAITPRILSRELRDLEASGLVDRKAYPVVPPKVEYTLTERGHGFLPIVDAISRWGMTGVHEEILGIRSPSENRT
jgi:DNA-binding HxlR family transcriptional regulator